MLTDGGAEISQQRRGGSGAGAGRIHDRGGMQQRAEQQGNGANTREELPANGFGYKSVSDLTLSELLEYLEYPPSC